MPIDTSERVFESEIEYCLTHLGKKSGSMINVTDSGALHANTSLCKRSCACTLKYRQTS